MDRQSRVDWYTAAGQLYAFRNANTPTASIAQIPYFDHLFPNIAGNVSGLNGETLIPSTYGLPQDSESATVPKDDRGKPDLWQYLQQHSGQSA